MGEGRGLVEGLTRFDEGARELTEAVLVEDFGPADQVQEFLARSRGRHRCPSAEGRGRFNPEAGTAGAERRLARAPRTRGSIRPTPSSLLSIHAAGKRRMGVFFGFRRPPFAPYSSRSQSISPGAESNL